MIDMFRGIWGCVRRGFREVVRGKQTYNKTTTNLIKTHNNLLLLGQLWYLSDFMVPSYDETANSAQDNRNPDCLTHKCTGSQKEPGIRPDN